MFSKLIPFLCWLTNKDPPFEVETITNAGIGMCVSSLISYLSGMLLLFAEHSSTLFSEQALGCLLDLLEKQVSEHSRHLVQYFQVFLAYAHRGAFEVGFL